MALDGHVPELLARALCAAATMAVVTGGKGGLERAQELLARAASLAEAYPSPLLYGNICSARAVCAMMRGRFEDVVEHSNGAERTFREASGSDEGEYYHRYAVITARLTALFELGEHQLATAELQRAVNDARATENVAALLTLSSIRTRSEIAADQAERALLRLEAEKPQLPAHRFGLLNAGHLTSVMRVGCATGDYAWTARHMAVDFERMQQSILKRGGPFVFMLPAIHARLLLNQAVAEGLGADEARRSVAQPLRAIAAAKPAAGVLHRTRARLALLAGDRKTAQRELERSRGCFRQLSVRDEAARDDYAYGALLGAAEGAALQASALDALRKHGYVNPLRDLRGYYPELFER